MFQRQTGSKVILAGVLALLAEPGLAVGADCGVLEAFGGRLQFISSDRQVVTEASSRMPVACDMWVATSKGWARVRHRDGFLMQVGENAFYQVKEGKKSDDHGVLYRGQVYLDSLPGSGELRVLTANGRARIARGPAVLSFDAREEQTQVVSLGNSASLENRFASSRKIALKSGEMSSMNFKKLRVVPSAPAPVSLAGLKGTLASLHLNAPEFEVALKSVGSKGGAKRSIASFSDKKKPAAKRKVPGYERHRASPAQDAQVKNHFVKKISAGSHAAEEILFPSHSVGRTPSSIIEVEEVGKAKMKPKKGEKDERQKLIDELTRIR